MLRRYCPEDTYLSTALKFDLLTHNIAFSCSLPCIRNLYLGIPYKLSRLNAMAGRNCIIMILFFREPNNKWAEVPSSKIEVQVACPLP